MIYIQFVNVFFMVEPYTGLTWTWYGLNTDLTRRKSFIVN
jgi:hypothetical protein